MHPSPARPRPCSTSLRNRTPRWPWIELGSARSRRRLAKAGSVSDYEYLVRESLDEGSIVRVFLNRPDARNAQNRGMLVELDDALTSAEANDEVRVIILGGLGPIFSSGHDLGSRVQQEELALGPKQHPTRKIHGGTRLGAEHRMLQEWHYYFDNTRRWRNLGKITIAQVHGNVLAAGLMLMWACDLIVAAEGTTFADVVGTRLGMCGLEYFGHPWEFGPRRAKELLLTGDSLDVEEAYRIGMVSKVYPEKQLADSTLEFARRIAKLPTVAALLIKQSVNQSVDQMGFHNALNSCFNLHQINHAHWAEVTGGASAGGTPEFGVPAWRDAPAVRPRLPA
jgi:enoyl-CoA hydratase